LLTPDQVQSLRDRVDINFDPTTPENFGPEDAITLELHVKHVPHLTVSIYEINTQNYYRTHREQIGTTWISMD